MDALRTVARGGSYLSSQVSDRLLARIQSGDLDTRDRSPLESLSPRELQVLRLVAEGKTSKDIAVLLDLGLQTVRSYRKTMMKKLGVNNVAGLTQLALAAGITHWNKPDANSLGDFAVSDAHVHFFSRRFLRRLGAQCGQNAAAVAATAGWDLPPEDPAGLARRWVAELDRQGVARAALIASIPATKPRWPPR